MGGDESIATDMVTPPDRRELYLREGLWTSETLSERVRQHAQERPDDLALVDRDGARRTGYAQLQGLTERAAGFLRGRGVGPGSVVSVQLPNCLEFVVLSLAAYHLGAVVHCMLPNYRARELRYMLALARTSVLVVPLSHHGFDHRSLAREVRGALGQDMDLVVVGADETDDEDEFSYDHVVGGQPDHSPHPVDPAAISELLFTSGTESDPKGIMHSEQTANFSVRAGYSYLGMTGEDVVWMPSPIGHSTGFNYGVRFALFHGLPLVLQDRWDPRVAVELIEAFGCTYTLAATTFLHDLVAEAQREGLTLSTMRLFSSGGAPIPADLVRRAEAVGLNPLRLYGSTEGLVITWNHPDSPHEMRVHTDGPPVPHVEVQIRDVEGNPLPADTEGEIFLRGPNTCLGFLRDPERTKASFTEDGWVRSGDLGRMDADGYLTVMGRSKEIIIRGGVNIAPREIEDVLASMPDVEGVAVVPLPHERLGEIACAVLVMAEDRPAPGLGDVSRFLVDEGLAKYKLPERLEIVDALPMTASGKIQKHKILDRLTAEGRIG